MINNNEILTVKQLTKSFGKRKVLQGIDFTVRKGAIAGLIGHNGVGKSTIMKCILGVYSYDSGTILLNGKPITNQNIGSLIEQPALYPFLTGEQHFKLYANDKESSENVRYIVQSLGLEKYFRQKVTNYSLGMRQKLGVALSFVNQPELVILDEPTNGLDPQANIELKEFLLSENKRGTTIIISSHILSELQKIISDVILINNGGVEVNSTLEELRAQSPDHLIIKTDNDDIAQKLLQQINISTCSVSSGLQLMNCNKHLHEILQFLIENNVTILDVHHNKAELEEILLNSIREIQEVG